MLCFTDRVNSPIRTRAWAQRRPYPGEKSGRGSELAADLGNGDNLGTMAVGQFDCVANVNFVALAYKNHVGVFRRLGGTCRCLRVGTELGVDQQHLAGCLQAHDGMSQP